MPSDVASDLHFRGLWVWGQAVSTELGPPCTNRDSPSMHKLPGALDATFVLYIETLYCIETGV